VAKLRRLPSVVALQRRRTTKGSAIAEGPRDVLLKNSRCFTRFGN